MKNKREILFQIDHALKYGVRVSQRSNKDRTAISKGCLFCIHFGRERKPSAKRANTKYYSAPFRAKNYTHHLKLQHPERSQQVPRQHNINAPIGDKIIGKVLWDPDEVEGESNTKMMQTFVIISEGSKDLKMEKGVDCYRIDIKNFLQQNLILLSNILAAACTFRQSSRVLLFTKVLTGLDSIGCASDATVAKCDRVVKAVLDVLYCTGYVDTHEHFVSRHLSPFIYYSVWYSQCPLLAIPVYAVYERHTGEVIFSTACEALDATLPQWRDIIIGTSSDGENKMSGRFSGCVTRFKMFQSLVLFEFGVARTCWTSLYKTCTSISVMTNYMEY
ncbi:hypothetical protein KXD40_002423 [Peronospora effusa]|nr:hypothetical protein KXD40_002423 [Peronospora effusa]